MKKSCPCRLSSRLSRRLRSADHGRGWTRHQDSGRSGASMTRGFFAPRWPSIWTGCIRRIGCYIRCGGLRRREPAAELRSFARPGGSGGGRPPRRSRLRSASPGMRRWTRFRDRFRKISAEFGSEAILPYSYGGTLAVLNGGSMDRRFFHRLGASQLDSHHLLGGRGNGTEICARGEAGHRTRAILLLALHHRLGCEHSWEQRSLWPFIVEARRQGAKLVVIDPIPHSYGRLCRLVSADQSRNRRRAGVGHDARHHQ